MPALTPAARLRLWLVQTGQGRTGFYSDSRFWNGSVPALPAPPVPPATWEATVGYYAASDRIVPAWQNPHVGGVIADGLYVTC